MFGFPKLARVSCYQNLNIVLIPDLYAFNILGLGLKILQFVLCVCSLKCVYFLHLPQQLAICNVHFELSINVSLKLWMQATSYWRILGWTNFLSREHVCYRTHWIRRKPVNALYLMARKLARLCRDLQLSCFVGLMCVGVMCMYVACVSQIWSVKFHVSTKCFVWLLCLLELYCIQF